MTLLEAIQKSAEFLGGKGVDSPRLQAELLLAHVLKLPRMQLYLKFEQVLEPGQVEALREMVRRRGRREPLQYILGSTSFCGLEIAVNRHVLVPRPETELLAEEAWAFLKEVSAQEPEPKALDYGTGSGCVAIALAVHCPGARIVGLELSAEALGLARQNAARYSVEHRLQWVEGDGLAALPSGLQLHLLVGNPPYIPTAEIEHLQLEVRNYEPHAALDGGRDGLDHYRRLATEAAEWLEPGGKLMLELGDGQAEPVRSLFQDQNWIVESIIPDYTQRPRILSAHR